MHKRTHSWSNPTSISSTVASGLGFVKRRYSSYVLGSQGSQAQMARFRKRRRIGSRTVTKRRRNGKYGRRNIRKRISRIWKFMRRKGLRNVETKYLQDRGTTAEGGAIPGSSVIGTLAETTHGNPALPLNNCLAKLHLTNVLQGVDSSARIGDKVFIKDIKFRGHLQANTNAAAANEVYVKLMVVRVKHAQSFNQLLPYDTREPNVKMFYEFFGDGADMDKPVTNIGGREAFINTWKWYNNRWANDFTILKTKVIKISKETGADYEKKLMKFNLRVNQPCHWEAGEPQDGHIYVYWFCDQVRTDGAAIGSELIRPVLRWTFRTTYTDV